MINNIQFCQFHYNPTFPHSKVPFSRTLLDLTFRQVSSLTQRQKKHREIANNIIYIYIYILLFVKISRNLQRMKSINIIIKTDKGIACHTYIHMQLSTLYVLGWLYLQGIRVRGDQVFADVCSLWICISSDSVIERNDVYFPSETIHSMETAIF